MITDIILWQHAAGVGRGAQIHHEYWHLQAARSYAAQDCLRGDMADEFVCCCSHLPPRRRQRQVYTMAIRNMYVILVSKCTCNM